MHANTNKRKAGVAILISDKVDFRERNIAKDKEGPFITLMCHELEAMTILEKANL